MNISVWFISCYTDYFWSDWWTGLNDRRFEGEYIWYGTDRNFSIILDYENFANEEPNDDTGDEDCVEIRQNLFQGFRYEWNDWDCGRSAQVICEINGNRFKETNFAETAVIKRKARHIVYSLFS